MALSRTSVFAAESTAVGAYTTSSFTPPANSLLVVTGWMLSDTDIRAGLSISGGGLTFTQRGPTLNPDNNAAAPGFTDEHQMWTAPVGASPSSMTVTITPPATNTVQFVDVHIVAYSGYDTVTPIGATGSFGGTGGIASGSSESLTLSGAPASSSYVFASMTAGANSAAGPITPGAGWTEIYDWVGANVNGLGFQSQERTASTSTTVSWANTDTNGNAGGLYGCSGLAIEIRAASGPVAKLYIKNQARVRASYW